MLLPTRSKLSFKAGGRTFADCANTSSRIAMTAPTADWGKEVALGSSECARSAIANRKK
jgi:hypothetical protein